MENKLQEGKKDTGESLTVLKEYLLEKKTFVLLKLVEIILKNEVYM